MGTAFPGHSCGGSGGFEPPSLLGLVSQATRDVVPLLEARRPKRNHVIAAPAATRAWFARRFVASPDNYRCFLQLRTIITK